MIEYEEGFLEEGFASLGDALTGSNEDGRKEGEDMERMREKSVGLWSAGWGGGSMAAGFLPSL